MIEKSQLIAKVAEKHNILISENDPIISVACMLEVFIDQYGRSLEASITRMKDETALATFQAGQQALQNAEKVTVKSLACFHKVIEDGGAVFQSAADSVVAELKGQKREPDSGSSYPQRQFVIVSATAGISILLNIFLLAKLFGFLS